MNKELIKQYYRETGTDLQSKTVNITDVCNYIKWLESKLTTDALFPSHFFIDNPINNPNYENATLTNS